MTSLEVTVNALAATHFKKFPEILGKYWQLAASAFTVFIYLFILFYFFLRGGGGGGGREVEGVELL